MPNAPRLEKLDNIIRLPTKPARREPVKPIRNIDTYSSHPGAGIEPEMIVSIFRQAEAGSPVRQYDLFEDLIEVDGHLRGLKEGRIQASAGKDWVLRSGRPGHAPSDRAAADLEERLRNRLDFREFLEHHGTAPFMGIAASALHWNVDRGVVAPERFINVPHRRFASPREEPGRIMLITGDVGRMELSDLDPGLWAVSRYPHRNPWAAGLMRTLTWWATFKKWAIADWQVFADMFGLPLAVGYYKEGASQESRNALEEAVRMIGEDGYAVLSDMTQITLAQAVRAGDPTSVYPAIADRADQEMSKLVTGGTLNTDVDGKGSYALADIHADRAHTVIAGDARRLEQMFVRDVGLPFVRWNGYGEDAAPPLLRMQLARDTLERAKVLQIIGQVVPLDEAQLREEFGLRVPAGAGVTFQVKAPATGGEKS